MKWAVFLLLFFVFVCLFIYLLVCLFVYQAACLSVLYCTEDKIGRLSMHASLSYTALCVYSMARRTPLQNCTPLQYLTITKILPSKRSACMRATPNSKKIPKSYHTVLPYLTSPYPPILPIPISRPVITPYSTVQPHLLPASPPPPASRYGVNIIRPPEPTSHPPCLHRTVSKIETQNRKNRNSKNVTCRETPCRDGSHYSVCLS